MKTYKPDLESTLVWTFCAFKLCFLNKTHKILLKAKILSKTVINQLFSDDTFHTLISHF